MSTPPVPTTKPDRPMAEPRPERRMSERATTPPQVLPAVSSQEPEHGVGRDGDAAEQHGRDRNGSAHAARHAAAQGAMAAGLTAAGLAGGALLEARVKPSRKLHIPRRRTRAHVIRDELVKRLP